MTDRRPLYLVANSGLSVAYAAPALRVCAKGRSSALFPLPQVSRIVSRGSVAWSTRAIVGCLQHEVPIVFVDVDGRVQGTLVPSRRMVSSLGEHLGAAVLAPDWPERYENWRCSQERRLIVTLASALGWELSDLRPRSVRRLLDQALSVRGLETGHRLLEGLLPCMNASVGRCLVSAGVPPELAGGLWGSTSLARDIAELAAWPLRGRLVAAEEMPPLLAGSAVIYYEKHLAGPIERTVDRLVRRLWQIPL